ncbi:uncharacterized protein N7498_001995 [Penicillium cinerascens]|uniref:CCHC-type domain-containing protein n=1 Tax=Penicillium cinerascens TaxID=70096 RepID=A0A9W9NAQ9_9EURO|nr:uncharacterized protein N7498_001995 [Penicillium cinerascens]KAJ5215588.1 hypothetical protein N7498_001995 [Penicillium cinerascens]
MPARRDERQGNASNNASTPSASDTAFYPTTTKSGLVRQISVATTVQDEDDGERTVRTIETQQGSEQPQSEFQLLLRANNELMIRFDRMSEVYAKNVEAITAESALYRQELETSWKEVNELQKEIVSLKELIQSLSLGAPTTSPGTQVSSPGRSWASIVSQSSLASSETRAARAGLGLPAVILDLRAAEDETKALVDDPTRIREKIRTALQGETTTASIDVVGVKSTSRSTIKIFVDSEESVANLWQATQWLNALPGSKLQGEQWFPVKLNDVKKDSIFGASGMQREDFMNTFQDENKVAQVKKIIWLSGKKRYGSMAVFLTNQTDAEALLRRRIVHVRGEAAFSDRFYERQRPLRCRKCQQYNHKEDRCPNSEACGKCAGNHRVEQCTSDTLKCASCQGNHAVTDRNCPKWDEA